MNSFVEIWLHSQSGRYLGTNQFTTTAWGFCPSTVLGGLLNLSLVPVKLWKQMQESHFFRTSRNTRETTNSVQKTLLEIGAFWYDSPDLTTDSMAWYPYLQLPLLLCTTQSSKIHGWGFGGSTRFSPDFYFHCVLSSKLSAKKTAWGKIINTSPTSTLTWKHLEVHPDVGLWPQIRLGHGWSAWVFRESMVRVKQ